MKKMQSKTLLALLLAALSAAPAVLSACGESKSTDAETTTGAPASEESTAEESTSHMPDVPKSDYNGAKFTFLTAGKTDIGADWETYDVWVESTNAEPINDAVYTRNSMISEHLGVTIQQVKSGEGDTVLATAQRSVQANSDDYDAIMCGLGNAVTMAQDGQIYNLNTLPHLDFANEWWDQKCLAESRILGKVYFATGDITVVDNDATWTLMFNKQMITDMNLDVPYELVKNNAWTFDKFREMIIAGSSDLDSNGKMNYKKDQFGFVTTQNSANGLFFATGARLARLDSDFLPTSAIDVEFFSRVVEKAGEVFADKDHVVDTAKVSVHPSEMRAVFEQGRGLFYGEVMQCIARMRNSDTDFGVIPWPKLDENQTDFYNMMHSNASKCVAVPMTQQDLEMTGAVLEYMAGASMYTLTPAYIDVCITSKYVRDLESAEMIKLILDSRVFDLGYICGWGGMYSGIVSLITAGKTDVASTISSKQKAFENAMQKTIEKFESSAS